MPFSDNVSGIIDDIELQRTYDKAILKHRFLEEITYYEKNEPSSPVPVLIKRAKRLVGADFVSIIKDIAPNGMDNVEIVAGITDDDD